MGLLSKSKKRNTSLLNDFDGNLLTEYSPFAIQEAYKTLRTNLMFSIPDTDSKVIVVTSGNKGEAKSTTAINLGVALAQNKSKVLLIDCDLRLPTIAAKLDLDNTPGLTNILIGATPVANVLKRMPNGLHVLPAGDIPPNPSELLGSKQMERLITLLSKVYEYIILDTPPVCLVSDALILSKISSGVLIVARQNVADRDSVDETVQKLLFAEAKILGFVFTGVANDKQKHYSKNGYYEYAYRKK